MTSMLVPLASGSTGNSILLQLGETRVLIDLGISCRRLTQDLEALRLTPADLDAVLITHAHGDHTAGLKVFQKHHSLPVYLSRATAAQLDLPDLQTFPRGGALTLPGGVEVQSFPTPHDCAGSVGYVLRGGGLQVGIATDLGCCGDEILSVLAGSDFQVLEFNHDVELLKNGPYPPVLQNRILSDYGHLSNDDAAQAAAWLAQHGTKRFLLAHLSQQNNTPQAALAAAQAALAGTGASCAVAPVWMGEPILLA